MVQDNIGKMEEEIGKVKVVEMGAQGAWTRWGTTDRRLSWSDIWRMEPYRIQVLVRSVYDLLPSLSNLHRWGLTETSDCPLCNRPGNLAHVLSASNVALTQGRYRWRHDKVLRELVERERIKKWKPAKGCTFINFVRGGEGGHTSSTVRQGGIIDGAENWEVRIDLDRRLVFPNTIQTILRPDVLIWSTQGKRMVIVELTVPWEERCEEAFERQKEKYEELAGDIRALGWSVWVFPVEIRCRGFPAHSTWRMFAALDVKGRDRRAAVDRMSRTAEKSSSWLWWRRQDISWKLSTDGQ